MKDSLFQILLDLFKNSLNQHLDDEEEQSHEHEIEFEHTAEPIIVKHARTDSVRVLSTDERTKLSDKSNRFLQQMTQIGLLKSKQTEEVLSKVDLSESHCVSIDELKWIIREVLDNDLSNDELAYLDLILYAEESGNRLQ
jgi:uncharacterized protein Smg (DUF494 family)